MKFVTRAGPGLRAAAPQGGDGISGLLTNARHLVSNGSGVSNDFTKSKQAHGLHPQAEGAW